MNYLESCDELLESNPKLAVLYYKCLTSPYEANLDDVRLILSSLPEDFPKSSLLSLYFLAEDIISNPYNTELLEPLKSVESYIDTGDISVKNLLEEFVPVFNHDINNILQQGSITSKNQQISFLKQYSQSILFANKISDKKSQYLKTLKDNDAKIDKIQRDKSTRAEAAQKRFIKYDQSSHDTKVQQSSTASFNRLKKSYPKCNANQNLKEIRSYISSLTSEQITKKNKANALSLLKKMDQDFYYDDAKLRLVYVWEGVKDRSKLTGQNTKGVSLDVLQRNLKETLIQQLASAETNYSVEGKQFVGSGRSCPGGVKNILLQVLDDYHIDVNVGYGFKGEGTSKLNSELAQTRFKELFLMELQKVPSEERKEISQKWNKDSAISDQVHLSLENRRYLLNAMNAAEDNLMKEYKSSPYVWYNEFRNMIYQNLSFDKASLLKPEVDLVYEYKEFLSSKKLSYKEMKEEIQNGGNAKHRNDLISWLNNKNITSPLITEEILDQIIPTIKKEELVSLRENILVKEYKDKLEPFFNKLSNDEKISSSIWGQEDFLRAFSETHSIEETLSKDLLDHFNKHVQVEYSSFIKQAFETGDEQRKGLIALAVMNNKLLKVNKVDKAFISQLYKFKKPQLESSLEELSKQRNSPDRAKRIAEISGEEEVLNLLLFESYSLVKGNRFTKENIELFLSEHKENNILIKFFEGLIDENGDTALTWAVKSSHTEIVEMLLEKGADVNVKNKDGSTALTWALYNRKPEPVKSFLKKGADVNTKDRNGQPILVWADREGHTEIVEMLLEKRVDINAQDKYGSSALIYATREGHTEIVEMLLEKGADVNIENNYGNTALSMAVANKRIEIVEKLLEKGADVNAKDKNGAPLLVWAAQKGHIEIVDKLLEKGADVNAKDKNGVPLLVWAAQKGHIEIVDKLLEKGADVRIKDEFGDDALTWAMYKDHVGVANKLLEKDVDLNLKDKNGNSALIYAAQKGYIKIVDKLLDKGADANAKDKNGVPPLFWAAQKGHIRIVDKLLDKGADVNIKDRYGLTALMYAVDIGRTEIVDKLLDKGADVNIKDNYGDSALIWAARLNNLTLYNKLSSHKDTTTEDINSAYKFLSFRSKVKLFVDNIIDKVFSKKQNIQKDPTPSKKEVTKEKNDEAEKEQVQKQEKAHQEAKEVYSKLNNYRKLENGTIRQSKALPIKTKEIVRH